MIFLEAHLSHNTNFIWLNLKIDYAKNHWITAIRSLTRTKKKKKKIFIGNSKTECVKSNAQISTKEFQTKKKSNTKSLRRQYDDQNYQKRFQREQLLHARQFLHEWDLHDVLFSSEQTHRTGRIESLKDNETTGMLRRERKQFFKQI